MEMNEYQKLAMRTDDTSKYQNSSHQLLNALMGLNGEAGEAIEVLKKTLFQEHAFDKEKLIKELGDCLWYIAEGAVALGVTLEDICKANLLKLLIRYPEGFSGQASRERVDAHDTNGKSDVPPVRDEP